MLIVKEESCTATSPKHKIKYVFQNILLSAPTFGSSFSLTLQCHGNHKKLALPDQMGLSKPTFKGFAHCCQRGARVRFILENNI